MKMRTQFALSLVFALAMVSCKGDDKNLQTETPLEDIQKMYPKKDSAVVEAYVTDKSTISAADIDLKDTSFSSRVKVLYKSSIGDKLAVVYGYKASGKNGVAIVQRNLESPVTLHQTKGEGVNEVEYSDGKVKLTRSGDNAFYADDANSDQFVEIK